MVANKNRCVCVCLWYLGLWAGVSWPPCYLINCLRFRWKESFTLPQTLEFPSCLRRSFSGHDSRSSATSCGSTLSFCQGTDHPQLALCLRFCMELLRMPTSPGVAFEECLETTSGVESCCQARLQASNAGYYM